MKGRGHPLPMRWVSILLLAIGLCPSLLSGACTRANPAAGADEDLVAIEEPVPPSFEPIVFPNPNARANVLPGRVVDDVPVPEDERGWQEKLALASGYAAGGFDDEALEVIRQTLAMSPPPDWAARLRDLRTTLKIRELETTLLRADVRGERDYVRFRTDVDWQVRIRNVSGREVVLATPADASPAALGMRIVRRDLDIYAAELKREWTQTVFLQAPGGASITIPPGGVHVQPVRIPAEDVGDPISGLRILEVGGTLRGMLGGTTEGPAGIALPLRPGRVVVLPDGFEPLTRDAVRSMEQAREAVAPPHLLVAAEFVPVSRLEEGVREAALTLETGDVALRTAALGALTLLRERAVRRPLAPLAAPLLEGLTRTPDRAEALMDGLAVLSGTRLPPDPRLWLDWGRRIERDGATVVSGETAGEIR